MRSAGVLLHISSLPSEYGIGSLGKAAYDFVDFLAKTGNKIWQILPIGPTSYGDSPYASTSAFAFQTYFIDIDMLVSEGLVTKEDALTQKRNVTKVNYEDLFNTREEFLHKAYLNSSKLNDEFEKFMETEASWLDDYAIYAILKKEHTYKPWFYWYDDFKYKKPGSLAWLKNEYQDKIREIKFFQFLAYRQYFKLKEYANKKGVLILGDIPIYCAHDSADVWANPELFDLNPDLTPRCVAGCPPDMFSPDGQLWGNPLYNYAKMKEDNYSWWVRRVKHSLRLFDMLRIDHFRGFEAYYAIPFGDTTARNGHWEKGPDYALFEAIKKECPKANIVAENLGFLTPEVEELLEKCKYPGMKIFEFELGSEDNIPLAKAYTKNNVFYTGTHDNQTIMSYYNSLNDRDKKIIDKICNIGFYDKPNLKIIEYSMNTKCDYCIIPLQDYLGLDDLFRMNTPSTTGNNWQYMARTRDFSNELAEYMKDIITKAKRNV